MATYSLFGSPASPSGSAGGGGATTSSYGVQFSVSSAAVLQQVKFYSPPGSTAALPDVMGLFDTSGNLVVWATPSWSGAAGSGWVTASFAAPVFLSPGTNYVAAIHQPFSSTNWNLTDSTYWSSGAGSGGITSGILSAPNNATAAHGQGSSVTGTAIEFPNTSMTGANIWIDVLVADAPANSYTILKQQPVSAPSTNDNSTYTMGMEFQASVAGTAQGVWFFSPYFPTQSPELPETIGIYNVQFASLVHSETPTWSGPAGSGWVFAAFSSPPVINATTNYKVVILKSGGSNNWYAALSNYWTSGAGASGLSNGPLSAPNNAGGDGGQDTFNSGAALNYPATSFNGGQYWIDVLFQPSGGTSVSFADEGAAVDALTVSAAVPLADVAASVDALALTVSFTVGDVAAAVDSIQVQTGTQVNLADVGAAVDALSLQVSVPLPDVAGATDAVTITAVTARGDVAAAADRISVLNTGTPPVEYTASVLPSRWHADNYSSVRDWSRITVMTDFEPIAAISLEDLPVLWSAELGGVYQDPTLLTPMIALPVSSGDRMHPAQAVTWFAGQWLAGTTIAIGSVAQFLLGPGGGVLTLTPGTVYDVWSMLTGGSESPAKFVGQLRAY